MDNRIFLDNLWRWKCGLPELDEPIKAPMNLGELRLSEWSPEFEKLMRNRMLMGAFRYGKLHEPSNKTHKRIESAIRRLNKYLETGNDELLVDVANLCLCEFEVGKHPKKHFKSIDDGDHCGK